MQVESPTTTQICKGRAATAEGEVSPAGALSAPSAASQTGAPQVAPRPAAASARQLPVQAAQAPAARLPATVESAQYVIGRRMQGLAARCLLQAQPQVKQAVPFLYGRRRAAVALGPGPLPSAFGAVSAASLSSVPPSQAPAPGAVWAGSPVSAPVQAPAPWQPDQVVPELVPAGAPAPSEAAVVEEAPTAEHESVILLHRALASAPAPAATEGATVEGSTGEKVTLPGLLVHIHSQMDRLAKTVSCLLVATAFKPACFWLPSVLEALGDDLKT